MSIISSHSSSLKTTSCGIHICVFEFLLNVISSILIGYFVLFNFIQDYSVTPILSYKNIPPFFPVIVCNVSIYFI